MKINPTILVVVAVILLGGLFLVAKTASSPSPTTSPTITTKVSTASSEMASSSAQEPNVKIFTLVVKNRKLVSGPDTLTVNQGDNVDIKITADEDEELHLHGYDKMVDLTKNQPADLKFTATLTGRFPYELEHSKIEIGTLEVLPK